MSPKSEISELTIGELARDAGCSVQSVHWYESKGLMSLTGKPDMPCEEADKIVSRHQVLG